MSGPRKGRQQHTHAEYVAAVARLDAQIAKSKDNAMLLDGRLKDYDDLRELLTDLPEKLTHPVMVPYGPLAFFEGQLQHTNEVLVQLSSEWFVERTAKHAMGTIDRRQRRIRVEVADVDKETEDLEKRRKVAASEGGIVLEPAGGPVPQGAPPGTSVQFDDEGFMDIREPLDDDGAVDESLAVPAYQGAGENDAPDSADAVAKRLKELEKLEDLEELEGEEDKEDGLDEMGELDDLVRHYEEEGAKGSCGVPVSLGGAPEAGAPKPPGQPILNPADLAKMMSRVEASSSSHSARTEKALAAATAARAHQPDPEQQRAFPGTVLERGAPLGPQASPASDSAGAAPQPPARISKFKADRAARSAGGLR